MNWPHPLSRKLFTLLMVFSIAGTALYAVPGLAYDLDPPRHILGAIAVPYATAMTLALYGFFKKFSWAWAPIIAGYLISIIEAFLLDKYYLEPNIPLSIYTETFFVAVLLALYGRAIRSRTQQKPSKVSFIKRDLWHWLVLLLVPVFGIFISLWVLGSDTVYTRTKADKKLYVPSSRLVLIAVTIMICLRFAFFSFKLGA